jgi:hypothetical protein
LQCPDPQKKQNCLKLWPCYNHICVLSCYFLFFLNTISFDTVG